MNAHPYAARPIAATHTWLTPQWLLAALGPFDLDPCAAPNWPTAAEMWCQPIDGLAQPWHGRVWLNPPFGRHTQTWLARMAEHNNGTALCFARTETRMFRDYVWGAASAILFLEGRPHFHLADGTRARGNSGGPIVLIAYGGVDAEFLLQSKLPGRAVRL